MVDCFSTHAQIMYRQRYKDYKTAHYESFTNKITMLICMTYTTLQISCPKNYEEKLPYLRSCSVKSKTDKVYS